MHYPSIVVFSEIGSLGGNFGVFPREDLSTSADGIDHDTISGSVFWFTVPLTIPKTRQDSARPIDVKVELKADGKDTIEKTFAATNIAEHSFRSSTESTSSIRNLKRPSEVAYPVAKRSASARQSEKSSDSDNPDAADLLDFIPSLKTASERPKCVLVIDDSITIRKALSKGFSRLGFHVDEAENGLQGFNRMKSGPYDLVLLDFLMPIMDGIDVAKKFRTWEQACRPWFHQVRSA